MAAALVVLAEMASVACVGATLPPAQVDALLSLYNATGGPLWLDNRGWTSAADPCSYWTGVHCGTAGTTVEYVDRVTRVTCLWQLQRGVCVHRIDLCDGVL